MWSRTSTVWARRSWAPVLLVCLWGAHHLLAQGSAGLRVPPSVSAGSQLSIETTGGGSATFYLLGPGQNAKRKVTLGQAIEVKPDELRNAGRYLALLCTSSCQSGAFYVTPAEAARLDFIVHPSRVPVRQPDVISGVALPFDRFENHVLTAGVTEFRVTADGAAAVSRSAPTQNGIAWFSAASSGRAGAVQVTATLGSLEARRVVQQVASDPCNLRITARAVPQGIEVQTEPMRDCAGNPVTDGTIVTFTRTGAGGQSTVDAPVKKGMARARMSGSGPAVISVASGLVMGNEVRIGGQP